MKIPIRSIAADKSTQFRTKLKPETIAEYSRGYANGDDFPPIDVFGEKRYLADGWQRVEAAGMAGITEIEAEIHEGGLREARLFAAGANHAHGTRSDDEYKRKAVEAVLDDPEWAKRSNSWIAEHCHVTHPFVAKVRSHVESSPSDAEPPESQVDSESTCTTVALEPVAKASKRRTGKDGKSYPAKKKPSRKKADTPAESSGADDAKARAREMLRNRGSDLAEPSTESKWAAVNGNGHTNGKATRAEQNRILGKTPPDMESKGMSPEVAAAVKEGKRLIGVANRAIDDFVNHIKRCRESGAYQGKCFGEFVLKEFKVDWDSTGNSTINRIRTFEALIESTKTPAK